MYNDIWEYVNQMNATHLFIMIYCWGIAFVFLLEHPKRVQYFNSIYFHIKPSRVFLFSTTKMPLWQFHSVWGIGMITLVLAGLWVYPQLMLLLSAIALFIYYKTMKSMSDVNRKPIHVILILSSLVFLPNWASGLKDTSHLYVYWLVTIILSQMYVSSAYQKIKKSGWKWTDGYSFRYYLLNHYQNLGNQKALFVAKQPIWLLSLMSVFVLFFEGSFFLVIFFPVFFPYYALAGILFHCTTLLLMEINYLRLVIWSYLGLLMIMI